MTLSLIATAALIRKYPCRGPDSNGAYKIAGWDVQRTGAGDWRASVVDDHGNYSENEYFKKRSEAFAWARSHPQEVSQ